MKRNLGEKGRKQGGGSKYKEGGSNRGLRRFYNKNIFKVKMGLRFRCW